MFGAVCGGPLVVFGPRQASCICLHVLRNSPGVRGVPAPQKKRHYYVITLATLCSHVALFVFGWGDPHATNVRPPSTCLFTLSRNRNHNWLHLHRRALATSMENRAHLRPLLLCLPMHIALLWRAQPVCVCRVMMLMIIWRGRGLAAPRALILK